MCVPRLTENWTEGNRAIHRFREATKETERIVAERISAAARSGKQSAEEARRIEEEAHRINVEREDAAGRVGEIILRTARCVAASFSVRRQFCKDFSADAVSHVWLKLDWFVLEKGTFEGWCYRVLYNEIRSRYRGINQDGPTGAPKDVDSHWLSEPVDPQWQRDRELLERRVNSVDLFSPKDLQKLEDMPVLRRIIALALAGWFPAAGTHWAKWLAEAGVDGSFPPQELLWEINFRFRIRLVAAALSMREDAVRQHWYRGLETLRNLDYGRERL